jgi:hypothetical protein
MGSMDQVNKLFSEIELANNLAKEISLKQTKLSSHLRERSLIKNKKSLVR